VAHSYTFTITATTCVGDASWLYTIRDNTLARSYSACGSRNVNYFASAWLWSGFEVWDSGDQFGGAGVDINISSIGSYNGSNVYLATTSTVGCCSPAFKESYWIQSATLDPDGHTVMHGRTNNH
jgi:hypothetical protein